MKTDERLKEEDYVDFGVGTVYCLGLFLCHLQTLNTKPPDTWINDAQVRSGNYRVSELVMKLSKILYSE